MRFASVASRFEKLCQSRGVEPKVLHANDYGDILYTEINPEADQKIFYLAGLHGDEAGGVVSVLNYLERSDNDVGAVLLPVWNAEGFDKNKRREGRKDPNRRWCDRLEEQESKLVRLVSRCNFLHTLHEDPEREEFYIYFSDSRRREVYSDLVQVVGEILPITQQKQIYGDPVDNGMIYRPHKGKPKHDCSVERFFEKRGIPYLTTETPGRASLQDRGDAGWLAMDWVARNLKKILA